MTHLTRAAWRRVQDGAQLELVRPLRQSVETVWAALTTPERLAAWMGVTWLGGDGPLRTGQRLDYRFADTHMESCGRVLIFDPPRVFEHSWHENVPPAAIVRWSLEPDGSGCVLTLTQRAGPPDDGPRAAAGWTGILEALAAHLREEPREPPHDWRASRDRYAAAFPPEATRDGRRIEAEGSPALCFERRFDKPPGEVWTALVQPEALARWLQAEAVVDGRVGGRFDLILAGGASRSEGRVLCWEPPRILEYTWPEREANRDSRVRFEIFPEGSGARLVLTHVFQAGGDLADFASGWHWHLDAFEDALEGQARVFDHPRWSALRQVYAATL